MKQFTIELEDSLCAWMEHVALITGEPIEKLIVDRLYRTVNDWEISIYDAFGVNEEPQ